jgi:maltose alpha-D-glucosyltransferase/alpha-amylase
MSDILSDDLWYKHAVMYCLDVDTFLDADGDGRGDFEGLTRKLDYLVGLGVTCLWLQPFYPSPDRDNGYDVSDYYNVNPRYGTLGDFVEFMNRAKSLGLRVIVDLVVSHTSNEHPWFQSARGDRSSRYRNWYVWSDERPANHDEGIIFPGVQKTNWTWDESAQQYYFHRFHEFQPDLDTHNPDVRREIRRIMGFWLELGASGFRMDAVPFLIERKGASVEAKQDFSLLKEMRDFLQWRRRDAILLAEANVPPEDAVHYFGDDGERLQMILNFPVNQRLFYALATGNAEPLKDAIRQTANQHGCSQWAQFLRSHDELDLGRLTPRQREETFQSLGPDPDMQVYGRGLRRRLAPMLGNDPRRIELAYSLLFSLPGTPMMQYGDEIGIGENLQQRDRDATRIPMQWSADRHGGFSRAEEVFRPVIEEGEFGSRTVNVAAQQRDPESFLSLTERMIRTRQECPEIAMGRSEVVDLESKSVLALLFRWRGSEILTLHNFSSETQSVQFPQTVSGPFYDLLEAGDDLESGDFKISGYGYRWFRLQNVDASTHRSSND